MKYRCLLVLFLLWQSQDQSNVFFLFFLLFSHLADAFIQSDLQIRKSNYNFDNKNKKQLYFDILVSLSYLRNTVKSL